MRQKGLFIVFEGIDGSGSSTQAELLKNYFLSQEQKAVLSPEPSEGIIGKIIRETLKKRILFTDDSQKFNEQIAYLCAADRHDHLYNQFDGVFKLINQGFQVITTRYYFSSLAYNGDTTEDFAFIKQLNNKFPDPDLVIYLDIPIEVSLERLKERSLKDIYENKEKLTKVKANYQRIFNQYSKAILQIDGTKEQKQINQQIVNFIKTNIA
ncbi:MAG: dTMP kinase [Spirulinaceae cyanobacterium]